MQKTKDMVLFWDGTFNQGESYQFVVDGIEYNYAERYIIAKKTRMLDYKEILEEIMKTDDSKEQKRPRLFG